MRTLLSAGALAATSLIGSAQQQPAGPPATEVYVATLSVSPSAWTLGKPVNISNSPGYDNQPFFAPDGNMLYFTSSRGAAAAGSAAPQTDIYRYDLATKAVTQVTSTPESEYSPTVTPDGKGISVIRVEADQTQRLWKFSRDGKNPSLVLTDIKPVGYHAWLDDRRLALFVLGQPATLQVADTSTGKAEIVARNIGPSVVKMPKGGASFVQQSGEGSARTFTITQVIVENGKAVTRPLTTAMAGATQVQVAWTPDGTLLMAHAGSLHAWRQGEKGWRVVADLNALGFEGVTRLAVSPKGDRIALVAEPGR